MSASGPRPVDAASAGPVRVAPTGPIAVIEVDIHP